MAAHPQEGRRRRQPGWDAEDHPQSVKTGRTNDEVKADRDAIWISQAPAATAEIDLAGRDDRADARSASSRCSRRSRPSRSATTTGCSRSSGTAIACRPSSMTARSASGPATSTTPRPTSRSCSARPRWIDAREAIVDGEVVALDEEGGPDFSLLQTRLGERGAPGLVYQAFDLLYLDGRSLLDVPLEDRKRLLQERAQARTRGSASRPTSSGRGWRSSRRRKASGVEGIVAKLRRSRYEPGRRSSAWLKIKIRPEQELVVGGWTAGEGNARDLGALAVGVYEDGKLRFAGKVGLRVHRRDPQGPARSGWSRSASDDAAVRPAAAAATIVVGGAATSSDITWVRPELVIRAELGGWTRDGIVRQTAFKGIEAGRDPTTVARETAVATTTAVRAAEAAGRAPMATDEGRIESQAKAGADASRAPAAVPANLARRPTTSSPRSTRSARRASWRVGGDELKVTNLDKPLFEPRQAPRAPTPTRSPSASSSATSRGSRRRCCRTSRTGRSTCSASRTAPARPGFWQKDIPETAPEVADPLARDRRRRPRRTATPTTTSSPTARRRCAGSATRPASRSTPGPVGCPSRGSPRSRSSTSTPARRRPGTRPWCWPGSTGPRSATSACAATRRRPASAASRSGSRSSRKYDFTETSAWVERVSRAVGLDGARTSSPGSGRRRRARAGPASTTPRTRRSRRWSRRTPSGRPRARRSRRRSPGTSWTTRTCGPTAGRSATIVERVEQVGDLFAAAQTDAQELPKV